MGSKNRKVLAAFKAIDLGSVPPVDVGEGVGERKWPAQQQMILDG